MKRKVPNTLYREYSWTEVKIIKGRPYKYLRTRIQNGGGQRTESKYVGKA